ncbi:MAG TPA: DUF1844 domain-containing protein [Vicinamibacterales bacterium]|nr:DUF1844 domain-containing protein [Vicinamibacterales bacterium]
MADPELSFTAFVVSLASTAAIHFGDMADPQSGQRGAPNLEGARQMIDILLLLEQKTRGNLTAEERQVLESVLYELRMRFVAAQSRQPNDAPRTGDAPRT